MKPKIRVPTGNTLPTSSPLKLWRKKKSFLGMLETSMNIKNTAH